MRNPAVRRKRIGLWLAAVALLAAAPGPASAGDWPQILGPQRDGVAEDESLADAWPAEGPPTVWERRVGSGFSGLAVADGVAVLFHRVGGMERVEAMDAASGDVRWTHDAPATFVPSYTSDNGPRAVPVIHGGRVYVYGAMGRLRCLDLASGDQRWERDTFDDYNSKRPAGGEPAEGYFGIGSSPLVEDGKLLVNVGGDGRGAGIVAFDLDTGRTVWKATEERASYSSPVAATVDGVRHALFVTRLNVVSLDPATGAIRFQFPFGRPGPTATGANPVVIDGHLFVTASYGFGGVFARLGKDEARELWREDDVLSSQYTTPVPHEGKLYGIHGRQDVGVAALRCIDPRTRRVHWSEAGFGYGTLLKADGKLLIVMTDGRLVLAVPQPDRYQELARAAVLETETRALPALSDGRLYIRDTRTLKCLDLGRPAD